MSLRGLLIVFYNGVLHYLEDINHLSLYSRDVGGVSETKVKFLLDYFVKTEDHLFV